jgi:signal transduction histidine kinase
MKEGPGSQVESDRVSAPAPFEELRLPATEEVEKVLDLKAEDERSLPGLVRLNVLRMPAMRLAGFNFFLLVALAHNHLLGRPAGWGATLSVFGIVELYCLGSWLVLWLFFARSRRVHLGAFFLFTDLLIMDVVLLYTGGTESLLWPVYMIRVADQLFAGRRRSVGMLFGGLVAYGLLLLWVTVAGETSLDPAREIIKLAALAGVGGYLVLAANIPLKLQDRALKAKELILRLEEQTVALNEERLRAQEASTAKTQFLARMSHELRTPMNSVIGFTNVLMKSKAIPPESREAEFLSRIRQNGMHLLALINDVLDLSRIEAGKLQIQLTDVDLRELVADTVAQLGARAFSNSVTVSTHLPDGPAHIRADEARLRQILINLVGNALKFTEEGSVEVAVVMDSTGTRPTAIQVADTGRGIDSERLAHIFHAFEQEDGTTSRKHGGTGLGLAISNSLCNLMGFTLEVESTVGRGSTFSVNLDPVEDA